MSSRGPTLDLHGYKTDEVFDALEAFFAKHAKASKLTLMPGKGSGKVRAKVIEYLKLGNYPWSYERLPNGSTNEGVLIVYME